MEHKNRIDLEFMLQNIVSYSVLQQTTQTNTMSKQNILILTDTYHD